jgi:hypothetical protein
VETTGRDVHGGPAGTASPQVRGHNGSQDRRRGPCCREGPTRTRGNSTSPEHNPPPTAAARRYPQVLEPLWGGSVAAMVTRRYPHPGPGRVADLTSRRRPAYRSSVTRCRRVPHVHARGFLGVGGRCRPKPRGFVQRRPSPSGDLAISRVTPLTNRRDSSEQAYVPAEQPPPPQGARIPAAHAHPRRALHPVRASPQGPQESRRLSPRGSTGPCLPRPCCRRRIASPAVTTCDASRVRVAAAAATPSCCTCCARRAVVCSARRRWASWSAAAWATRWSVIGSSAGSGISSGSASTRCRRAARSSSEPSRPRPARRTRNSAPTSTVVSSGCSVIGPAVVRVNDPSTGRGV